MQKEKRKIKIKMKLSPNLEYFSTTAPKIWDNLKVLIILKY